MCMVTDEVESNTAIAVGHTCCFERCFVLKIVFILAFNSCQGFSVIK